MFQRSTRVFLLVGREKPVQPPSRATEADHLTPCSLTPTWCEYSTPLLRGISSGNDLVHEVLLNPLHGEPRLVQLRKVFHCAHNSALVLAHTGRLSVPPVDLTTSGGSKKIKNIKKSRLIRHGRYNCPTSTRRSTPVGYCTCRAGRHSLGMKKGVRSSGCHLPGSSSCKAGQQEECALPTRIRCEIYLYSRTIHDMVCCAFCKSNSLSHIPQVRQTRGRPQLEYKLCLLLSSSTPQCVSSM